MIPFVVTGRGEEFGEELSFEFVEGFPALEVSFGELDVRSGPPTRLGFLEVKGLVKEGSGEFLEADGLGLPVVSDGTTRDGACLAASSANKVTIRSALKTPTAITSKFFDEILGRFIRHHRSL